MGDLYVVSIRTYDDALFGKRWWNIIDNIPPKQWPISVNFDIFSYVIILLISLTKLFNVYSSNLFGLSDDPCPLKSMARVEYPFL